MWAGTGRNDRRRSWMALGVGDATMCSDGSVVGAATGRKREARGTGDGTGRVEGVYGKVVISRCGNTLWATLSAGLPSHLLGR